MERLKKGLPSSAHVCETSQPRTAPLISPRYSVSYRPAAAKLLCSALATLIGTRAPRAAVTDHALIAMITSRWGWTTPNIDHIPTHRVPVNAPLRRPRPRRQGRLSSDNSAVRPRIVESAPRHMASPERQHMQRCRDCGDLRSRTNCLEDRAWSSSSYDRLRLILNS